MLNMHAKKYKKVKNATKSTIFYCILFFIFFLILVFIKISLAFAQENQKILSQRYQDWLWVCLGTANGASKSNCEIAQSVQIKEGKQKVEILNLALSESTAPTTHQAKDAWRLIVLTPLDVHLPSQFGLVIGKNQPIMASYRNCNHLGCFVVIPIDKKNINNLRRAFDGTAVFRLLNNQVVKIRFSLRGFSRAFDKLQSDSLPTQPISDEKIYRFHPKSEGH